MHHALKIMLALTLTGGAPKKDSIPLHLAGQFDAITTNYAISHCPPTYVCQEHNPLFRPFAGTNFAYPAMWIADDGYLAAQDSLRYHGHPKWATAVEIGAIALHIYCGVHNIRGLDSISFPAGQPPYIRRPGWNPRP